MTGRRGSMSDDQVQRLSAALRAQAAGMATGFPPGQELSHPASGQVPPAAQTRAGLPAWAVLALAVLLGATAGGLAGAISAW